MKKFLLSIATVTAITQLSGANVGTPRQEVMNTVIQHSPESPETSLTATKAQFYYYPNYYGDGTSCYQVVMTNCESGFSEGGQGTLPNGPGQLLCVFLCGPQSADKNNPEVPVGEYTFAETPSAFTFSSDFSHWVDAFTDSDGSLKGWQMPPVGGTISITKENGVYSVVANITVKPNDGDEIQCSATYNGEINKPGPMPGLPSADYSLTIPNLSGIYYASEGVFNLSFYGCQLDENGFIIGRGDLTNVMIVYRGNGDLLNALVGEHTCVPYLESQNSQDGNYLGGYLYAITSDFVLPMGTYNAIYNDYGQIEACGLAAGGTINVAPIGDIKDGNLKFDFNLTTEQGGKMTGSWSGNVYGKIEGLEPAGVEDITDDNQPIMGLSGCIVAPSDAQIFTISGTVSGRDNLQPGIYVVRHNGNVKKVIVK